MGLFRDPCTNCSRKIKKSARFCPHCGSPGPKVEFACPRCQGHNSGPSNNCRHCGESLYVQEGNALRFVDRPNLVEKSWARDVDDVCVRLHVQDVQGRFSKWVVIEEGTRAFVFQNGQYAGEVPPGRHNHTGLTRRVLSWFNLAVPAVFLLADTADIELELVSECRTSENLPVHVAARVVVSLKNPLAFMQNLLKGSTRMMRGALENALETEVGAGVQASVHGHSIHSLVGNLKLRDQVLDLLARHLGVTLSRYGFGLVHVSSITCEPADADTEKILGRSREQFSVVEESRAAIKKAEAEAAALQGGDVLTQAEHQVALKDEARQQQLDRLKDQGDLAGTQHAVAKKTVSDDYDREAGRKDQEQQLEILQKKREGDLATWQQQQEAELLMKKKKLEMYSAAPPAALAAILEGSEFDRLMKVEELRAQQGMPPEQMLIFVAGKSPEVAKALAQKYVADGSLKQAQAEKVFAEQKADLVKDMAQQSVDRVADVAARSGGAGSCPNCSRAVQPAFNNCPYCGAGLKKV